MEGALEQADLAAGAQRRQGAPDGLYLYTAAERWNSALVLEGALGFLVMNALQTMSLFDQIGAAIADVKSTVLNQVLNTFAANNPTDNSEAWKQTVDADAVSPQNLMFCDPPLYGFAEPLIYRSERIEQVTKYVWKKVAATGTVEGQVRHKGKAVAGAAVQISDVLSAFSNNQGNYKLEQVPIGDVIVYAQKVMPNAVLVSGQAKGKLTARGQTIGVNVELTEPPPTFRRIVINGDLKVVYYQWNAAAYPINLAGFTGIVDLEPNDATHAVKQFDCLVGNDALGRLILTFDLQPGGGNVKVSTLIRCYDAGDDQTDDYDEAAVDPFILKPGRHGNWWAAVDGDNYAEANFELKNKLQPS